MKKFYTIAALALLIAMFTVALPTSAQESVHFDNLRDIIGNTSILVNDGAITWATVAKWGSGEGVVWAYVMGYSSNNGKTWTNLGNVLEYNVPLAPNWVECYSNDESFITSDQLCTIVNYLFQSSPFRQEGFVTAKMAERRQATSLDANLAIRAADVVQELK